MDNLKNILFLNHVTFMGGAEMYLASIWKHLDQKRFQAFFISQEPGDLTTEAERSQVYIHLMKLRGWRKLKYWIHNRLTIQKLMEFCQQCHIDLICSNCYRVTPYAVLTARRLHLPTVTIVQDFVPSDKLKNFCVFDCDHIVTVSKAIADSFRQHYTKEITPIYNGIDADDFRGKANPNNSFRKEFHIGDGVKIVGMIAHVIPLKGHKYFLEAMRIVAQSFADVIFVVVGDALYPHQLRLEDIKRYAQEMGILDRAIFTGERNDVPTILRDFDVLVHPSQREAFSRVVAEAMVMGKPVVATRCGGPEEIVVDGKTGYLVPKDDAHLMADRVLSLLSNDAQRFSMGVEGKKRVEESFSPEKTVGKINDLFQDMLKNRPSHQVSYAV